MANKPALCRFVLVRDPQVSADPFPAVINQVWSDDEINVRAFPANGDTVQLDSLPLLAKDPAGDDDAPERCAWWPSRV